MAERRKKEIRILFADGTKTWDICWVKVRPQEIQGGFSSPGYGYHTSFHRSGDLRITKQNMKGEVPAAAQVIGTWRTVPLSSLYDTEHITDFALPTDPDSLSQGFEPPKEGHKYSGTVLVDGRQFSKKAVGLTLWVARRHRFSTQNFPKPPGFRHIFEFGEWWIVIDVEEP